MKIDEHVDGIKWVLKGIDGANERFRSIKYELLVHLLSKSNMFDYLFEL
jgi:hypothetical protein